MLSQTTRESPSSLPVMVSGLGRAHTGESRLTSDLSCPSLGPIAWTAIPDLGLAIALLLVDRDNDWRGKTVFLSQKATLDLRSVCSIVDTSTEVEIVSPQAYVDHYKSRGMDTRMLEWWVTTYPSLEQGHAAIDDPLLEELLAKRNKKPIALQETIRSMVHK